LARELYTARLARKECISEVAQCYHFEFVVDEMECFPFIPGQFVSAVAPDPNGKQQTRAYSIASAPKGNSFELCVLQEPITDSILIATGTGVAPMRGYAQWLFPEDGPDRSNGKEIWLVYGTRHETDIYYQEEFEALAARKPNFHYVPTLSRALDSWTGRRGHVQVHIENIIKDRAAKLGLPVMQPPVDPTIPPKDLRFDIYAYICGLNFMVSGVRDMLSGYNWHRKQIVFERYD